MIRGNTQPVVDDSMIVTLRGFDDYDLRLGDVMRGERATLGKSLLEVQRDLRIRAGYLAAIENGDLSAFESRGFVAGYVKSYARYLGLDPDWAYEQFCRDSGFSGVHELKRSEERRRADRSVPPPPRDAASADELIIRPRTPFSPAEAGWLAHVDRAALGSMAVLLLLVAAIGVGAMGVLREIQRVELADTGSAPVLALELDPLDDALRAARDPVAQSVADARGTARSSPERETPILVARDGPISTIDPDRTGTLAPVTDRREPAVAARNRTEEPSAPPVVEAPSNEVALFAVRPAWIRVSLDDGTVLFERILEVGEIYRVPESERPIVLRAGNSGSLYMNVGGATFGPVGSGTSVARSVSLAADSIRANYAEVTDLAGRDPFAAGRVRSAAAD